MSKQDDKEYEKRKPESSVETTIFFRIWKVLIGI
jgi:hypothetical protein